jgi:hypothetical protein
MIEINQLTKSDVGAWVGCRDRVWPILDRGRIKSWNEKWIFVVYRCGGNWDEFEKYTGVATDPRDLEYVTVTEEESTKMRDNPV